MTKLVGVSCIQLDESGEENCQKNNTTVYKLTVLFFSISCNWVAVVLPTKKLLVSR